MVQIITSRSLCEEQKLLELFGLFLARKSNELEKKFNVNYEWFGLFELIRLFQQMCVIYIMTTRLNGGKTYRI